MDEGRERIRILVADDDPDDCVLVRKAVFKLKAPYDLFFVSDGAQLLDFLYGRGIYSSPVPRRPDLILLDLNMPKLDGRAALSVIKKDEDLKCIPVVIFSTSNAASDMEFTLNLGAKSFITKPSSFGEFKSIIASLADFR